MILPRSASTLGAIAFVLSLGGCAAVLGLEPTEVVGDADGGGIADDGGVGSEGGVKAEGGIHYEGGSGDTPPFEASCGTAITTLDASGQEASSIVADANGIFWVIPEDASTSLIYANFGSGNQLVVGSSDGTPTNDEPTVLSLALDSTHLYWSAWNTYNGASDPPHLGSWSRLGSHPIAEVNLSGAGAGISQIAIAAGLIYWGNWKTVGSANLYDVPTGFGDGDAPILVSGGLQSPFHFASDGVDKVYYDEPPNTGSTAEQTQVAMVSVSAGGPDECDTVSDNIEDLAVGEGTNIYWTDTDVGKIRMHPPNHVMGATTTFVSMPYPHFLAYDAEHHFMYVAASSQANVYSLQRVSTTASNPTPEMCVDNLLDISAIHYFGGHVYFSAASDSGSALFDLTTNNP